MKTKDYVFAFKEVIILFLYIFQLYICDENTTATEYDFKKALDLLQFIDSVSKSHEKKTY